MKRNYLSKFISLSLSLTMIFGNTITARADEITSSFNDVNPSRWSAPYIESFYEKGYISGYPDGTFKPKEFITRAEVSAIFAKVGIDETKEGLEFVDVSPNDWYYDEINTITKIGLATGYPDGTFKPNNLLTRNEAFKVAATTFKNTDVSSINPDFVDQYSVAEWAEIYEKHLMYYDVLGGFPDNSVRGDANITREEFVKLLFHIINDENISETIKESIATWDTYYEQINNDVQTGEVVTPVVTPVVPPVVTPTVTPAPSEKPSSNGGGSSDNSDSSDDSSNTITQVSRVPVINSITAGDNSISGTGISGSTITVTMPGGKTYTVTVDTNGTWSVSITETLAKNDVVKATQIESGKTISANATATVSDKPVSQKPVINDITEGDKNITGTGIAGAEITVTMPNNKTYTTTVGSNGKWSIDFTENVLKDDVIKATQTENNKNSSDTTTTTVKELILLNTTRASLKTGDPLGPNTFNTKTGATYPHYGTDKPVFDDEIIITLNDKYTDSSVEYYKLTTADTTNYTVENLPSGTPITVSNGRITGLANGDKYVIVSTGNYNGEQKSVLSTIVINNIRDGSKENPFAVYDLTTLESISDNPTAYYDQIDVVTIETLNAPISSIFSGSYYGNNNKINILEGKYMFFETANGATIDGMNIEINDTMYEAYGQFGIVARQAPGCKLSNITVTLNGDMIFTPMSGLVVGVLPNGSAEHITVNINGNISSENQVGGFAGLLYSSSIDDVTVNIASGKNIITTSGNVGGIAGAANDSTVKNSIVNNNGTIKGKEYVGGAFGNFFGNSSVTGESGVRVINNGTIESFGIVGTVPSSTMNAGGFAGVAYASNISKIDVTNTGVIKGSNYIGGIFGQVNTGTIASYNYTGSGSIIATDGTDIGKYYGLNSGATFTPEVTTEMNTVVSE